MYAAQKQAGETSSVWQHQDIDSEHIWVYHSSWEVLHANPVERRSGTPASARAGKTHRSSSLLSGASHANLCPSVALKNAACLLKSYIICAGKTHRELFSEFYEDLLRAPLAAHPGGLPRPTPAWPALFQRMMHDILSGGQTCDPVKQVCPDASLVACVYASGNLGPHSSRQNKPENKSKSLKDLVSRPRPCRRRLPAHDARHFVRRPTHDPLSRCALTRLWSPVPPGDQQRQPCRVSVFHRSSNGRHSA